MFNEVIIKLFKKSRNYFLFFGCILLVATAFADGGQGGAKAVKGCSVHAGNAAKVKSCCTGSTQNQETEAKERKEAAICIKLIGSPKAAKS